MTPTQTSFDRACEELPARALTLQAGLVARDDVVGSKDGCRAYLRVYAGAVSTKQRLLVVSNRLPLTAKRVSGRWRGERSSGGLVAAMAPLMEQTDGLWLGWPGDSLPGEPEGRKRLMREWEQEHGYVAVEIPPKISRSFYEGYANDTLWPLLHGFPTRVVFAPESWHAYRDANERFADAVASRVRKGDLVWAHDYQLMLVPQLIRERSPEARIGFFLHIPFPSSEVFRILPEREDVLLGLLGADSIAFQTHGHLHNFRRSLLQVLGLESSMDQVQFDGRRRAPLGAAHRHPVRGMGAAHQHRPQGRTSQSRAERATPWAQAHHLGRPSRLHQGHPRALAHVPSPAAVVAHRGAARSRWSRSPCHRVNVCRPMPSYAARSPSWWARSTATSARPNGSPWSTCVGRSTSRSWRRSTRPRTWPGWGHYVTA